MFQLTIPRELNFSRREGGGVQVFEGAVGSDGVWRSSFLFLKKPLTLVIFRGGGGVGGGGTGSPDPHLSMD